MMECVACGRDLPRMVGDRKNASIPTAETLTDQERLEVIRMMKHPGWRIYLGILQRQYHDRVAELVKQDGDARVQLARQMECRTLLDRLAFEQAFTVDTMHMLDQGLRAGVEQDEEMIHG